MTVICASTPWEGLKFQDRHIAESLARHRPVLYVDPPLSIATMMRGKRIPSGCALAAKPIIESDGLARMTVPAPPYPERPGVAPLTGAWYRYQVDRAAAGLADSVRAVIGSRTLFSPFGSRRGPLKVFWAQDDIVGGATLIGFDAFRIARTEALRAGEADVVVASNPDVAERWRRRGYETVLIPFGCDSSMYAGTEDAPLPDDVTLTPPIAGFIGSLVADRMDFPVLESLIDSGESVLFVGPSHRTGLGRLAPLMERPNVQWVGRKPFEALPSYMRVIDVGIVPYADNAFNRGSFPLKTLEYLAAGKPVVATGLPALRWLDTPLADLHDDPKEFTDCVRRWMKEPASQELVRARREFASGHSWEVRARCFDELLSRQGS